MALNEHKIVCARKVGVVFYHAAYNYDCIALLISMAYVHLIR